MSGEGTSPSPSRQLYQSDQDASHGVEREKTARKVLTKTGVQVVDEEAVIVQACLARLANTVSLESKPNKPPVKVISNPKKSKEDSSAPQDNSTAAGGTIDISHRGVLGARPEEPKKGAKDEQHVVALRSDAVVAQIALDRLMRICKTNLDSHDFLVGEHSKFLERKTAMKKRIAELENQVAGLQASLEQYKDPAVALQKFRDAFDKEHHQEQQLLLDEAGGKKNLIQGLIDARKAARAKTATVRAKRTAFQDMTDQMENEFGTEESVEFNDIMKVFQPKELTVEYGRGSRKRVGSAFNLVKQRERDMSTEAAPAEAPVSPLTTKKVGALPTFQLDSSMTMPTALKSMDSSQVQDAGAALLAEEAGVEEPVQDVTSMMSGSQSPNYFSKFHSTGGSTFAGVSFSGVMEDVTTILEHQQKADDDDSDDEVDFEKVRAELQESRKRKQLVEEMVITRVISTGHRLIRRQDPEATLISLFHQVVYYNNSKHLVLAVNLASTAGRREKLNRQAEVMRLSVLWDEMNLYSHPQLCIIDCPVPTSTVAIADGEEAGPQLKDGHGRPIIHPTADVSTSHLAAPLKRPTHIASFPLDSSNGTHSADEVINDSGARQLVALKRIPDQLELSNLQGHQKSGKNRVGPTAIQLLVSSGTKYPLAPHAMEQPPEVIIRQREGIVHYICTRFGKKKEWTAPSQEGYLRMYASSQVKSCSVDALVRPFYDLHSPYFSTHDAPGQHVSLSFSRLCIVPTGYSIASTHPVHGGFYPRHWRLEASLDGVSWVTLSDHSNDDSITRYTPVQHFSLLERYRLQQAKDLGEDAVPVDPPVGHRLRDHYQHFRIHQTGPNAVGTNHLCISSLEIYGRLCYVLPVEKKSIQDLPSRPVRKLGFPTMAPLPECSAPKKGNKKKK